jgi:hypothetical protein
MLNWKKLWSIIDTYFTVLHYVSIHQSASSKHLLLTLFILYYTMDQSHTMHQFTKYACWGSNMHSSPLKLTL